MAMHAREMLIMYLETRDEFRKEVRVAALATEVRSYCHLVFTAWNTERFIRK